MNESKSNLGFLLLIILALGILAKGVSQTVPGFTPLIRINQVGFATQGSKAVAIVSEGLPSKFFVRDANDGHIVYQKTLPEPKRWDLSDENVTVAEFSEFSIAGTYYVDVPGVGTSYIFSISSKPYAEIAKASMKAFYFNRASIALDKTYASIYARALGHPDEKVLVHSSAASPERPAGFAFSSPKGWYDAGDYNCYIVNSSISVYTLLAAYEDFKGVLDTTKLHIPESNNTIPDMLDEIRWNLDWMLTMQDPNDGGVYNKKTNAQFDGMVMPHVCLNTRYVTAKGTTASFDFAATMAYAYRIYKTIDQSFANQCLEAAKKAYAWGEEHPDIPFVNPPASEGYPAVETGEYGDKSLADEYTWAAAELLISTKDRRYYEKIFNPQVNYDVPDWTQVQTLGLMSLLKNRKSLGGLIAADTNVLKKKILGIGKTYANAAQRSPYRIPMGATGVKEYVWGSNAVAANQGMVLLFCYQMTKDSQYLKAAEAQNDYLLGRNPSGYCYVTGFGKKSPMRPHHRQSEADGIADPVPGWLVGGPQNSYNGDKCYNDPQPAKAYVDDLPCYSKNEVAINWNAPWVYLVFGVNYYR